MDFNELIAAMGDAGIYSVVIPFLLAFSLTYGVLEKIKLFGKNSKYNLTIAVITGFLTTSSMAVSAGMNSFLEKIGFGIIIMLAIILILGLIGIKDLGKLWYFGGAVFLIIVWFQFSSPGIRDWIQGLVLNRYVLIVIGAILTIWWITGSPAGLVPLPSKAKPSEPKKGKIATPASEVIKDVDARGKIIEKSRQSESDLYEESSDLAGFFRRKKSQSEKELYDDGHAGHGH